MRGVPTSIKYDHSVGRYKVDPQASSPGGDQEEFQPAEMKEVHTYVRMCGQSTVIGVFVCK